MENITSREKRDAIIFTVCLCAGLFADGLSGDLAAPAPTAVLLDKPAHQAVQAVSLVERIGEDPDEDTLITAALVEQGYFSMDVPLPFVLQDALHTACERHRVPYHIALGLIEVESRFDTNAVNRRTGCYGLCQLSPQYFPGGLSPVANIEAGISYLGKLLERYNGDVAAALTAYNAGYDTGRRDYANAVLAAAEQWMSGSEPQPCHKLIDQIWGKR